MKNRMYIIFITATVIISVFSCYICVANAVGGGGTQQFNEYSSVSTGIVNEPNTSQHNENDNEEPTPPPEETETSDNINEEETLNPEEDAEMDADVNQQEAHPEVKDTDDHVIQFDVDNKTEEDESIGSDIEEMLSDYEDNGSVDIRFEISETMSGALYPLKTPIFLFKQ